MIGVRRHSRETFRTLLVWYASWGIFGMASLLGAAIVARLLGYGPLTSSQAILGLLVLSPVALGIFLVAYRRLAQRLAQQRVKATLTESGGLEGLGAGERRKRKRR